VTIGLAWTLLVLVVPVGRLGTIGEPLRRDKDRVWAKRDVKLQIKYMLTCNTYTYTYTSLRLRRSIPRVGHPRTRTHRRAQRTAGASPNTTFQDTVIPNIASYFIRSPPAKNLDTLKA
jgi:hypothetical protein